MISPSRSAASQPSKTSRYSVPLTAHTARRVFGEAFISEKRALRELSNEPQASPSDNFTKVQSALMKLGFRRQDASRAMNQLRQTQAEAGLEALLRAALRLLTSGRG